MRSASVVISMCFLQLKYDDFESMVACRIPGKHIAASRTWDSPIHHPKVQLKLFGMNEKYFTICWVELQE